MPREEVRKKEGSLKVLDYENEGLQGGYQGQVGHQGGDRVIKVGTRDVPKDEYKEEMKCS